MAGHASKLVLICASGALTGSCICIGLDFPLAKHWHVHCGDNRDETESHHTTQHSVPLREFACEVVLGRVSPPHYNLRTTCPYQRCCQFPAEALDL